jgi:hypothetical protein
MEELMLEQLVDVDSALKKLASETVVQGENLRARVRDLTLQGMQARELSLKQIKAVLKSVTEGVNAGAAKAKIDVEKPLADAFAGMDDALLKVVNASQMALDRLLDHGADFENSTIRNALGDLDRLEDEFLNIVRQSAAVASKPVKAQWGGVFAHMPAGGTGAGAQAEAAAARFAAQMRSAIRRQRDGAAKTTHLLVKNYGTLASGILIGLSDGLGGGGTQPTTAKMTASKPRKAART